MARDAQQFGDPYGQIAHRAYVEKATNAVWTIKMWRALTPREREGWCAAAEAVRTAYRAAVLA